MAETRYFQWLTYEKNKEVTIFDRIEQEDGINYVVFKNDARCNEELIAPLDSKDITGKVMAEIEDPNNMWTFKEEIVGAQEEKWETNADGINVCVIPFLPGKKKITPIPPKPAKSKFGKINNIEQPITQINKETEKPKPNFVGDPIWGLLEKAKKSNQDINIALTIPLPAKGLYDVAKENFENGDKKVCDFIVENIDITYLKDCLKEAIRNMYENKNE